jgi:Kazal-type serine protease inhibitor domain
MEANVRSSNLFLTILVIGLSACTVTVDEGNPPPRPGPRPGICPRIYQPVCATRFGERQTFPNGCVAETRGFDIIYGGECRNRAPIIDPPISPRPRPTRTFPYDNSVVCPSIVAPVCASNRGIVRTFQNACIAQGSGFRVVGDGPC